jgi:hypothetical protein
MAQLPDEPGKLIIYREVDYHQADYQEGLAPLNLLCKKGSSQIVLLSSYLTGFDVSKCNFFFQESQLY